MLEALRDSFMAFERRADKLVAAQLRLVCLSGDLRVTGQKLNCTINKGSK